LMLRPGMQSIAAELSERIGGKVDVHLDTKVTQIHQEHDGSWVLNCNKSDLAGRRYDQVILAVPQVAMKGLTITTKSDETWSPGWLNGVRPRRLLKMFLVYESAWWENDESSVVRSFERGGANRVFTDLPLRQVYFFSPQWMLAHGYPTESHTQSFGLVMASYSDEQFADFWAIPTRKTADDRPWMRLPTDLKLAADFKSLANLEPPISERVIAKVHGQLAEILAVEPKTIPFPICGFCMDWQEVGGGWHTWESGHQPWKYTKLHNPLPNLFVCGEAFSTEQGWIEGALRTAEQVVSGPPFSLPRPTWGSLGEMTAAEFHRYIKPT
jgi:hypothetical protein